MLAWQLFGPSAHIPQEICSAVKTIRFSSLHLQYIVPRRRWLSNGTNQIVFGRPRIGAVERFRRPASSPSSVNSRPRQYATDGVNQPVTDIAVLGGGVTGLASAYYLSKEFPKAKIILFDSKEELGGWIKSKKVEVDDGEVLFEQGPRSLRPQAPNGTLTLRAIQDLGLTNELLITSKSAPAAQNRFLYYPDHLVRMPGPGMTVWEGIETIWNEPVFQGSIRSIYNDFTAPPRSASIADESIGNFLERRGSTGLVNNLVSALYHGIYAGDVWQLSARSILPLPWKRERKHGSFVRAAIAGGIGRVSWNFCDDVQLQMELQDTDWNADFRQQIIDCSVFTFRNGLGQLAKALEARLSQATNVEIQRRTAILSIEKDERSKLKIMSRPVGESTAEVSTSVFSHAISTIPPAAFTPLISKQLQRCDSAVASGITGLNSIPATTVHVVNLYYNTPSLLRKISPPGGIPKMLIDSGTGLQGFGYLIPNSIPFSQNPERALGVIFDSDIAPDLWTSVPPSQVGTRITVMLGGHWWDGWTSFPSDFEAQEMAKSVLARHLGIQERPVVMCSTLQCNCIPQYVVGHEQLLGQAHKSLLHLFDGRLRVAGSWYTGVGVNDCFRAAWDVVQGLGRKTLSRQGNPNLDGRTGLERFYHGRPMVLVRNTTPGSIDVAEVEESGEQMDYFPGVKVEGRSSN